MSWRTTLLMGGAFVAACLLRALWRPSDIEVPSWDLLFKVQDEQVTRVEIQPLGQPEIILERAGTSADGMGWQMTKPVRRPAWDPYVKDMLSGLRELTTMGGLAPGHAEHDLSRAGLSPAELVVTVDASTLTKPLTFKFGRPLVRDPSQRWFQLVGDEKLYVGPTSAYEPFVRKAEDLRHMGVAFFDRLRITRIELHQRYTRLVKDAQGQRAEEKVDISEFAWVDTRSGDRGWYWVRQNERAIEERLDEERINETLGELAGLRAHRFVEASDLVPYGLDKPTTLYRLWTRDAPRPTGIAVGGMGKTGEIDVTYLRVEGDSEVIEVPTARLARIGKTCSDFRSRQVYDFARDEVRSIEIKNDLGLVRILRKEKEAQGQKEEEWIVEHPAGLKVQDENLRIFVETLFTLKVKPGSDGFLGPQEDLSLFGLKPPMVTMSIQLARRTGASESAVFAFGKKPEVEDTYMMKPGSDEVFAAGAVVHATLDKLDLNFRSPTMFSVPREQITSVSVEIEKEADPTKRMYYWVEKTLDNKWVFRDSVNQGEVDTDQMKDVLTLVNFIEAEEFISRRTEVRGEYGLAQQRTPGRVEVKYVQDGIPHEMLLRISGPAGPGKQRYALLSIDGREDPILFRLNPIYLEKLPVLVK